MSREAPIRRDKVPPTSQSRSIVPYPTSSLIYSNSKFWNFWEHQYITVSRNHCHINLSYYIEICNFFVGNYFITKKKKFNTGSSKQFSKTQFVMEEVVMEEKLYEKRYHWGKRRIKLATFCALSIKTFLSHVQMVVSWMLCFQWSQGEAKFMYLT